MPDVGGGFGPPTDHTDVEVVLRLNSEPQRSMGFQLRNDGIRAARQGMLDLLRDGFNHNWTVAVGYDLSAGKTNGVAIRVALRK